MTSYRETNYIFTSGKKFWEKSPKNFGNLLLFRSYATKSRPGGKFTPPPPTWFYEGYNASYRNYNYLLLSSPSTNSRGMNVGSGSSEQDLGGDWMMNLRTSSMEQSRNETNDATVSLVNVGGSAVDVSYQILDFILI